MPNAITNIGYLEEFLESLKSITDSLRTITIPEDFFARGMSFTHSNYYQYGAGIYIGFRLIWFEI
jgi:hypothetical protein